jgi:hypothetical protein
MQITPSGGIAGTGVSEAKLKPSAGQAGPVGAAAAVAPAITPPQAILGVSAVIRELAVADLLKLAQIMQPTTPPERVMRVDQLIKETIGAIREERIEWAVGRFIEAATTDPTRVDELQARPEFEAIRGSVDNLMVRLSDVAKMDAETKLSSVEQTLENAGWPKLPNWETAPQTLVQIGHRLLEAGGYANYVRTAELATTLQAAYWNSTVIEAPVPLDAPATVKKEDGDMRRKGATGQAAFALAGQTWDLVREGLSPGVAALWQRAPLLVLLGGWFLLGLAGGLFAFVARHIWPDSWFIAASDFGFRLWGLGFLAFVGFGFWARVRKPRA